MLGGKVVRPWGQVGAAGANLRIVESGGGSSLEENKDTIR